MEWDVSLSQPAQAGGVGCGNLLGLNSSGFRTGPDASIMTNGIQWTPNGGGENLHEH